MPTHLLTGPPVSRAMTNPADLPVGRSAGRRGIRAVRLRPDEMVDMLVFVRRARPLGGLRNLTQRSLRPYWYGSDDSCVVAWGQALILVGG
jgi:hypothetical protein